MHCFFQTAYRHTITEANINFYATPFVHPERKMKEHDFIYLLQGEWKLGQNEKIYELKQDSLLILHANQHHFGVEPCLAGTKTMYFHASCEEGDVCLPALDSVCGDCIPISTLTDASNNPNIKKYFSEIVNCKLHARQKQADILFDLLLCELSENHLYAGHSDIAVHIKNIIHNNPEAFFSNRELARLTKVSVKTAENKFKAQFGVTIHQYILKFKTEEAISYFRTFPEMTVKEIAYNLGFYDEYHFSKQFKKITGLSPLQYRRQRTES